jgi:hypothetical protein
MFFIYFFLLPAVIGVTLSTERGNMSKAVKKHFYDKDKQYFINLRQTTKAKCKQTTLAVVFALGLLTLLLLKGYSTLLSDWLFAVISTVFILAIYFIRQRIGNIKPKGKEEKPHNFSPVSYGVLYFGFTLSLWPTAKTDNWLTYIVPVLVSLVSAVFLVAVFSQPLRKVLNTKAAPLVVQLTFWVVLLGFFLDLIPALIANTGTSLEIIVYFGFLWLVIILLAIYRDVKYELVRLLSILAFIAIAGIKFNEHTAVGNIGGATLLVIAGLMYCVAVGHLTPYGSLED